MYAQCNKQALQARRTLVGFDPISRDAARVEVWSSADHTLLVQFPASPTLIGSVEGPTKQARGDAPDDPAPSCPAKGSDSALVLFSSLGHVAGIAVLGFHRTSGYQAVGNQMRSLRTTRHF